MPNATPDGNHAGASKCRSGAQNSSGGNNQNAGASPSTPAQRAAMARYREKNQSTLREKARIRMARRRAQLAQNSEDKAQYQERARAADARYREAKAGRLSSRQVDRRAMAYIQKYGPGSWLEREAKRAKFVESMSAPRQSQA